MITFSSDSFYAGAAVYVDISISILVIARVIPSYSSFIFLTSRRLQCVLIKMIGFLRDDVSFLAGSTVVVAAFGSTLLHLSCIGKFGTRSRFPAPLHNRVHDTRRSSTT